MKNSVLWLALVLGLISVGVSAQAVPNKVESTAAPASKRDVSCAPATGSHISGKRAANGECEIDTLTGRSYTQEDLERTGSVDLGEAIRKLDPSLR